VAGLALVGATALLALAARRSRVRREAAATETWACGYARPTARMQYTASSFAQLLLAGLAPRDLQPRGRLSLPRRVLPRRASASFRASDPARARLFDPAFRAAGEWASRLRRYQAGRLNLQLLYTVATLLALAALLVLRAT
jgi:hydrogenase-4 component B